MARKEKPLQLRMVEDSEAESSTAVRLDNRETEWRAREPKPVRLGPRDEEAGVSRRLDLPDRDEVELRSHQPGIDVLIEPEPTAPELVEENWGEASARRHPVPWGWFALIALIIFWAVVWSLSSVEKADPKAIQIRSSAVTALVEEEREEREAAQLIGRLDETLRAFANVTSVEALSRLIRQPRRVTPLMRRYYADHPVYPGPLRSIKNLAPLTVGNRGNFWLASVVLGEGELHGLVLEIGEDGEPRIDWETFVCHQPMDWDDFSRQRPVGNALDFRVFVETDHFYSHEFADSNQWVSFRLTALKAEETLFGYARVGSPTAQELLRLCEQGEDRPVAVILRLGVPEGLRSRNGVVIEKLVCERWLYLDPPDSGS